jgi:hypothetical protein
MKASASIEDLARFVQLQHELATALVTKFGLEGAVGAGWPRHGEVEAGGHAWQFQLHGLGYRFETERGGRPHTVVDFHHGLPGAWTVIDAWRIATYLGSIRSYPPRADARSRPLLDVVTDWLESEAGAGRLETVSPGEYRVVSVGREQDTTGH